jgi:hypothetical protein
MSPPDREIEQQTPEPEGATRRHADRLDALRAAIFAGPGALPPQVRRAAASNEDVPEPFTRYVETIHRHAYRITDRMVSDLGEAGADDDQVFEMSVAAAYGAARARLDAGLRAVEAARGSDR